MVTIVCWLWKTTGWRNCYNFTHVNALHRMISATLSMPHKFVCVTDQPRGIECETIPLWDDVKVPIVEIGQPNCYKRLWLFSEEAEKIFGEYVISIDLDCVILNDITNLFDLSVDFKINKGQICPYNGALWFLKTGSLSYVWDCFDPEVSPSLTAQQRNDQGGKYFGSDQAWISFCVKDAPVWGAQDGIYHFSNLVKEKIKTPKDAKIVFFAGRTKPWDQRTKEKTPRLYNRYMEFL